MTEKERIVMEDGEKIARTSVDWSKLKGKGVLISGANGYVPQYLVHGLLKRNDLYHDGIKVVAMCRSRQKAMDRFSPYIGRPDFELLMQDVRTPVNYEGDVDYVIHGASPAGMASRHEDPVATFDANVIGCGNLLRLAEEKKAQFLLISSVDIYGEFPDQEQLTEERHGQLDPMKVRNVYSCAKRAAETLCACYGQRGISCKVVRPFQILAGGIGLDDGRLHGDFVSQMLKGDEIVLKGDGMPRRSFLYVTDAIAGMLWVLLEGRSGEAYNLCDESGEASVLELARMMGSQVTDRDIRISYNMETRIADPAVTQAISRVCGNSEKIRMLGWRPQVSLMEACKRMMAYYGLTSLDEKG